MIFLNSSRLCLTCRISIKGAPQQWFYHYYRISTKVAAQPVPASPRSLWRSVYLLGRLPLFVRLYICWCMDWVWWPFSPYIDTCTPSIYVSFCCFQLSVVVSIGERRCLRWARREIWYGRGAPIVVRGSSLEELYTSQVKPNMMKLLSSRVLFGDFSLGTLLFCQYGRLYCRDCIRWVFRDILLCVFPLAFSYVLLCRLFSCLPYNMHLLFAFVSLNYVIYILYIPGIT